MLARRMNEGVFPVHRLRGEFDRLLRDMFGEFELPSALSVFEGRTFPALNVWEDDKNVFAEAELPGLNMDDMEVLVIGNELTIKGERKIEEREGVSEHRRERVFGQFSRVVRLPVDIDAEHVTATLRNGILTVTMPKSQSVLPRKIAVKAS